jgi:hypothetical protein
MSDTELASGLRELRNLVCTLIPQSEDRLCISYCRLESCRIETDHSARTSEHLQLLTGCGANEKHLRQLCLGWRVYLEEADDQPADRHFELNRGEQKPTHLDGISVARIVEPPLVRDVVVNDLVIVFDVCPSRGLTVAFRHNILPICPDAFSLGRAGLAGFR